MPKYEWLEYYYHPFPEFFPGECRYGCRVTWPDGETYILTRAKRIKYTFEQFKQEILVSVKNTMKWKQAAGVRLG